MLILGHLSLQILVSTIVKLYLVMCVYRSDVARVHQIMPFMYPLLLMDIYMDGYSFHPYLLFFHLRLKYSVLSLPKDELYVVAMHLWFFQHYGLCHLLTGLED